MYRKVNRCVCSKCQEGRLEGPFSRSGSEDGGLTVEGVPTALPLQSAQSLTLHVLWVAETV